MLIEENVRGLIAWRRAISSIVNTLATDVQREDIFSQGRGQDIDPIALQILRDFLAKSEPKPKE